MKNNLSAVLKRQFDQGAKAGGLYWTMLMTLAIYNLYGWKHNAFDKIEAEMKRIDDEMRSDDVNEKSAQLMSYIEVIRGKGYLYGRN